MKRSFPPSATSNNSNLANQTEISELQQTSGSTSKRAKSIESNENPTTSANSNKMQMSFRTLTHLSNSGSNGKTVKDQYPKISKSIWEHFCKHAQSCETFHRKLELKDALYNMFKDIFPYLGVFIVGSSANGFGTNSSDVDICLMVSHEEVNQKAEAICLLRLLARALRKAEFIKKLNVISAKVPIIKFHDSQNSIDCDININNHIGIRNTHLMKAYSDADWRVKPLVLAIKNWAKYHSINDASKQTLSSYSLSLMTIYFLQISDPPVLPILQELRPDKFNVKADIRTLRLNDDAVIWSSSNNQTLGELFAGFIEFYSNFDFESKVISVRMGKVIPKNALPSQALDSDHTPWKFILIEEPFDLTNTARAVYDYTVFREIVNVFDRSNRCLKNSKSYEQLFTEKYFDIDKYQAMTYSGLYDRNRF